MRAPAIAAGALAMLVAGCGGTGAPATSTSSGTRAARPAARRAARRSVTLHVAARHTLPAPVQLPAVVEAPGS